MQRSLQTMLSGLPDEWPEDLLPVIQREIGETARSVVVLDDDPTGTQTVYDTPILTDWHLESIRAEFANETALFYILTNSRSLTETAARDLALEIGRNLRQAARETGRRFAVISRSDSTLRGHFPAEVDALAEALGEQEAVRVVIPSFMEGGRHTIGDVHYVREGEALIPAADTPFARDAVFGYRSSNLREWIEEKTAGRVPAASVVSLSLEDIRQGGPDRIAQRLSQCRTSGVCVVNAAGYRDLEVVTLGLLAAEKRGQRFVYRTAASFVRVRAGLAGRALLAREELDLPERGGGLIVVGSYVPKSTAQLAHLLKNTNGAGVEVRVEGLLADDRQSAEIARVVAGTDEGLARGRDVVIHTSRDLVTGGDAESNLAIGHRISSSLVRIVREISVRPRYILAKGGITSSDVATKGLGLRRAQVLGQVLPGVPVWRTGPESRLPGLVYIVFPGNVGGPEALTEIVRNLHA